MRGPALIALALALALGGCSALFNPYDRIDAGAAAGPGSTGSSGTSSSSSSTGSSGSSGSGSSGTSGEAGRTAVALAAGGQHSCAIAADGTLWCWGADRFGQLGDDGGCGTRGCSRPVQVAGIAGAEAVAAGQDFTCAIARGGLFCWGDGSSGQLGPGSDGGSSAVPVSIKLLDGGVSTAGARLSCGAGFACLAQVEPGEVVCWGGNASGQLGRPADAGAQPVVGLGLLVTTAIAAEGYSTCALGSNGGATPLIRCWGENGDGQLGDGANGAARESPADVQLPPAAELGAATRISGGLLHACVSDQGGSVWCWGSDAFGQLGSAPASYPSCSNGPCSAAPIEVLGLPDAGPVASLSAGGSHTCAVAADGSLWCWGANDRGQLGTALAMMDGGSSSAPMRLAFDAGGFIEVAAGGAHTCARASGGQVLCWGANDQGELGTPDAGGPNAVEVIGF